MLEKAHQMIQKILSRLREPSTYAGLAAVVVGVGELARINEAHSVAAVITSFGDAIISGQYGTLGALAFGVLAAVLPDRTSK